MTKKDRTVFDRLYASAQSPEDLPWHDSEPPRLLVEALNARDRPGSALDVGCGAGTHAVYLASRGCDVTAIDFTPRAVEMAQRRAAEAGRPIRVLQADVRFWSSERQFDVVLDVGCLHSLRTADRSIYRQQLLSWLAPGGDYLLSHFGRRGWWDRWPLGPHRVARADVIALFSPELSLQDYEAETLRMPLLVGHSAVVGRYWFRKSPR